MSPLIPGTKRILITGGNGFVGRRLTALLARDHDVLVLDSLRYDGRLYIPETVLDRVRLERVDLREGIAVAGIMTAFRPEVVVHLAAIHFIPECESHPDLALATNVAGTVHLLRHMPAGGRFVLASSGAVYAPAQSAHREDDALAPQDIYGLTKLHAEHYLRYFARRIGFAGVAVRLFNVVGPGETNRHLLPELVTQLRSGASTLRLGALTPHRDYIHVADAAGGFAAAALQGTVAQDEFCAVNIGTGRTCSVADLARLVADAAGLAVDIAEDTARLRKVDRPMLRADIGLARTRFGWAPRRTLADAVAETWADPELPAYLLHPDRR